MSRITKLTKEVQAKICKYVEHGNTYERACGLTGIGESTFYAWKHRGEQEEEGIYKEFQEAVKKADDRFIAHHIENINKHSQESWQASAWMLERKKKKEFGKNLDITTDGEKTTDFTVCIIEDDGTETEI